MIKKVLKSKCLWGALIVFACILMMPISSRAENENNVTPTTTTTPTPTPTPAPIPVIYATDATTRPGGTVAVEIDLSNNPGIWGVKFEIEYDKNLLKLVDIMAAENSIFDFNDEVKGPIDLSDKYINEKGVIFVASANKHNENKSNDGAIVKLLFNVSSSAGDTTTDVRVKFDQAINSDEKEIEIKEKSGKIRILNPSYSSDDEEEEDFVYPRLTPTPTPLPLPEENGKRRRASSEEEEEEVLITPEIIQIEENEKETIDKYEIKNSAENVEENEGLSTLQKVAIIVGIIIILAAAGTGIYFGIIKKGDRKKK